MFLLRMLLSLALLAGSLSAAARAEPRAPTGQWVVDFHASQCVASRSYGTKQQPLELAFKAPALGNVMQVAVIRPGKPSTFAQQLNAWVVIGDGAPLRSTMTAFTIMKGGQRVFRLNLPLRQFAAARSAKVLSIRANRELDESFALDRMDLLRKLLHECVVDLRREWNVTEDDGAPGKIGTSASADLRGLFNAGDYPEVAVKGELQGTVKLVVLVDELGMVADCTVAETSGVASLDSQSCAVVVQRARFKPAMGVDGRPVKSGLVENITWRMQ